MKHLSPLHFLLGSLAIAFSTALVQAADAPGSKTIAPALQPFVESHSLAGAVTLVADGEKVLAVDTVGYSNVEAKTAIKPDAVFWIASMSKPITAAALMILVDEGKVKLDDPIEKFLPEFKETWVAVEEDKDHVLLKRPKRSIQVRDCLNHTSGMPFTSKVEGPELDILQLKDGVRSYAMTPLKTEPGTKYAYSNAGINTAGRIIEVVSKMSFEDFLDKRLFAPLGMKDTTFWPTEEQVARLATSYKPTSSKDNLEPTKIWALQYPLTNRKRTPMPGGGLFSTADDLRRFCQMMLNKGSFEGKQVLTPQAMAELTKKQTAEGLKEQYGLGFTTNQGVFGHGGAYSTNMLIDSNKKLITIFLVQHAGFPGNGNKSHDAFRKAAIEEFSTKN